EAALTASSTALEASRGALAMMGSMMSSSIQPTYDETKKLFDAVRDGELKKDNDAVLRELQNRRNQAIIGAESIYITCAGLNAQDAALTRSLAALARSEEELRLRNRLGQVSDFTLQSVENGRIQAESGKETLQMNIGNLLLRLKVMTGIDMDAELSLAALPTVTAEQLAAMSPEQDLAAAQEASYELYAAKRAYDDAKEEYDDALKKYGSYSKKNEWMQAKHTWQAAQYTYENAKQSYELKFRTLYAQVKDAAQIIESKRAALAAQEKSYQVSALKYQQGTISANELANAGDELAKVKDELASAERDLFTQYRSYQWAVEYGILNS
ncbi:MAG: TolC family protein, partial [Oscillospiraceae bacterium]|nr:TolC family protein [Oscillospiraceae bacterium]